MASAFSHTKIVEIYKKDVSGFVSRKRAIMLKHQPLRQIILIPRITINLQVKHLKQK